MALAAITSCTNTSDPGLLVAAGLVAAQGPAGAARAGLGEDFAGPRLAGCGSEIDLGKEPLQRYAQGRAVDLQDLWPTREEVAAVPATAADPADSRRKLAIAERHPAWHALQAPASARRATT